LTAQPAEVGTGIAPGSRGGRKCLIVTADDFGAAVEVNDAVERAHRDGILTAASLMVSAPAAADAVARARTMPKLGVGLHLVLVEGRPALPPSEIPALVGPDGNFRLDMVRVSFEMFLLPSVRRQLAAEIEAQFAAFAATGLKLDHVNAHKHFHLHPTIAGLVVKIGRRFGMTAMRVPFEPVSVLREIEPGITGGTVERIWARRLQSRLRASGIFSPDQVFGLCWSGAMTPERLLGIVSRLPDGISEIYLHPATGSYAGSTPGYRYESDLDALMSGQVFDFVKENNIAQNVFADFAANSATGVAAAHQMHPAI
jgi:chitin disaccharide deacetylase